MSKKKISTLMEPGLYRRVKLESARRGEQISDMIGEAVSEYLERRAAPLGGASVVDETWGALAMDRERLDEMMDEDGLFDA